MKGLIGVGVAVKAPPAPKTTSTTTTTALDGWWVDDDHYDRVRRRWRRQLPLRVGPDGCPGGTSIQANLVTTGGDGDVDDNGQQSDGDGCV